MGWTVAELAAKVGGVVEGDGAATLVSLAGLREAQSGDLSFLSNPRYAGQMGRTQATAVLVNGAWSGQCAATLIRVDSADRAFAEAARLLSPSPVEPPAGIHPTAVIADGVEMAPGVSVGPHCVLEPGVKIGAGTALWALCFVGRDSVIGAGCRFYPLVSLREHTRIGDRVIIHNGAVIGSDGFGYVLEGEAWRKIPQVGRVEIGNDVEIGANVTIDRARFGRTVIGAGAKLDNLVQIAHNVRVGEHVAMAAQVGVAGSTVIGRGVRMGGQSGVAGHLVVGDRANVAGQAGVTKDVPPGMAVSGYPAAPHDEARRLHAMVARLPQLREHVAAIEERLQKLERLGAEGKREP
jgi:UDP-3-O-[3-hydroxymyristoyl] glucosamine N-acyltransferase